MVLSKSRLPCKRSGLSAASEGGEDIHSFFKHAPKKKKVSNEEETVEESIEEYSN